MAKRDRRDSFSPKSKAWRPNGQSGERVPSARALPPLPPASAQSDTIEVPGPCLGTGRRLRTPLPGAVLSDPAGAPKLSPGPGRRTQTLPPTAAQSDSTNAPTTPLGIGRRIRTQLPGPVQSESAGAPKLRLGSGKETQTPAPAADQSHPTSAPTTPLGTGRRIRTQLPGPVQTDAAGAPKLRLETGSEIQAPPPTAAPSYPSGPPAIPLGTGTRLRTQLPEAVPGELEEINLEVLGGGPLGKMLREKAAQFANIQDFLQNPVPLDLRSKDLDTSSTPDEIEFEEGRSSLSNRSYALDVGSLVGRTQRTRAGSPVSTRGPNSGSLVAVAGGKSRNFGEHGVAALRR